MSRGAFWLSVAGSILAWFLIGILLFFALALFLVGPCHPRPGGVAILWATLVIYVVGGFALLLYALIKR